MYVYSFAKPKTVINAIYNQLIIMASEDAGCLTNYPSDLPLNFKYPV